MELKFINISDLGEIGLEGARKTVRSHVMQNFRHQQRLDIQRASFKSDTTQMHKRNCRILPKRTRKGVNTTPVGRDTDDAELDRAYSIVGGAVKESFDRFSLSPVDRCNFGIFDHYGAAVAGGLLPLGKFIATNPLRTKVLPLVVGDSALFHTILANSGMDMMTWRGEKFFDPLNSSPVRGREHGMLFCLRHKLEGIRIINEKLKDPVLSISDETILAVSHLAGFEMLASAAKRPAERFKEFEVHMDGIEQMVKLRGGLKAVGMDTCLTHLILRIDRLHSALTKSKPRFSGNGLLNGCLDLPTVVDQPPKFVSSIKNPMLLEVLHQLCGASEFLESLQDHASENDFFSLGIQRVRIEDNLFRLALIKTRLQEDSLSQTEQCCRSAALLYVQTVLTKVNCKVYKSLVTVLKHGMERTGVDVLLEQNSSLLLWMLLVGGGAAPYNVDRPWFLKNLAASLHTPSWEEVEQRLAGWPWRPKYCASWRIIWREAVMLNSL